MGVYFLRESGTDAASMTSYFPQREATVFYINVGAMRSSGLLEKLVGSTMGEEQEYKDFVSGSGFDYKRDLNQMMLNSAGGIHYFLLEGRFDWDKLRAYAMKQGGKCDEDGCFARGSTPDRVISFRKLRKNLMALASARDESGARAIERRRAEPLPWQVPSAPVWAHVPADAVRAMGQYPSGTRLFAKALESSDRALFMLSAKGDAFELAADVTCRTPEDAAILKAQLEGITSLLQKFIRLEKQKPSEADLSGILTSGAFERTGTHVRATWPVPKAFVESLSR